MARIRAEARYIPGRGFVAHQQGNGPVIREYSDLRFGAGADAQNNVADDALVALQTWKPAVVGAARSDPLNINDNAVIPCWVTIPD